MGELCRLIGGVAKLQSFSANPKPNCRNKAEVFNCQKRTVRIKLIPQVKSRSLIPWNRPNQNLKGKKIFARGNPTKLQINLHDLFSINQVQLDYIFKLCLTLLEFIYSSKPRNSKPNHQLIHTFSESSAIFSTRIISLECRFLKNKWNHVFYFQQYPNFLLYNFA